MIANFIRDFQFNIFESSETWPASVLASITRIERLQGSMSVGCALGLFMLSWTPARIIRYRSYLTVSVISPLYFSNQLLKLNSDQLETTVQCVLVVGKKRRKSSPA